MRLELKVLADAGLLGLPNAGKSTLIAAVSNARPKVADYPFTTLHPNLGVVRIDYSQSFVLADVPGLIEGAAQGAGLGHQFLKHLSRTRVLLHLVDLAPFEADANPVRDAVAIVNELRAYDEELWAKPRWLVLNKIDMIAPEDRAQRIASFVEAYKAQTGWQGEVHAVSGLTGENTRALMAAVYAFIAKSLRDEQTPQPDVRFSEAGLREQPHG